MEVVILFLWYCIAWGLGWSFAGWKGGEYPWYHPAACLAALVALAYPVFA